jgi:hypothetical protein
MAAKATSQKAKRKKSATGSAPATSMRSIATQNLINMVAVCTTSGVVLLTLLAARHF